jgi:hypothetical protein
MAREEKRRMLNPCLKVKTPFFFISLIYFYTTAAETCCGIEEAFNGGPWHQ